MAPFNPSLLWSKLATSGNESFETCVFTYPAPRCSSIVGRSVSSTFTRAVLEELWLNPDTVMLVGNPSVLVWPDPPTKEYNVDNFSFCEKLWSTLMDGRFWGRGVVQDN